MPLSYKSQPLGHFAITAFRDEDAESPVEKEEAEIALVRQPGMVVEYYKGARIQLGHPQCDAVFLADRGMDESLAKAEPPAHDRWDHKFTRGDRPLTEKERKNISTLLAKVRNQTRAFLNRHQERPPTPPDRCRELERLLGKHLRAERDKPPPPEGDPRLFRIRFVEQPHREMVDGNVVVDAKVEISLSDHAEPKEYLCELRCWVETLVERSHIGSSLPMEFMEIRTQDGDSQLGVREDRQSTGACLLRDDEKVTVDLRSARLPHPEYAARFVVQAEDKT